MIGIQQRNIILTTTRIDLEPLGMSASLDDGVLDSQHLCQCGFQRHGSSTDVDGGDMVCTDSNRP